MKSLEKKYRGLIETIEEGTREEEVDSTIIDPIGVISREDQRKKRDIEHVTPDRGSIAAR